MRDALLRQAINPSKPTSALWARTELVWMDLTDAVSNRERLPVVLTCISGILKEAEGHLDYPVEPVVRIAQDLGRIVGGDDAYDELIEAIIQFQAKRVSEAEQGQMRLERGYQKLAAGKTYDAIDQFAKAQNLLALDEHKGEFIGAVVGTALSYEAAGLLWAARANLAVALDRTLYEYFKDGRIAPQALPLLRKLVWVEMQLGRVPCVLAWIEWLGLISHALELDQTARKNFDEEFRLMDAILGILVLKTRYADWSRLDHVAGLLERFSLLMSRAAVLFSLGYEDAVRLEFGQADEDLDQFFSLWLAQPATADLPMEAEWHLGRTVVMRTVLMGCEIELIAENKTTSILLGEAILAFLESFLSTAIRLKNHYTARPYLRMEVRQSKDVDTSFTHQVEEDECGETRIIVMHPTMSSAGLVQASGYQEALFKLLAELIAQLQVPFSSESLTGLFANDRAHDRAFFAAQSPLVLTNVLGEKPKYHIQDWIDNSLSESFTLLRTKPWKPATEPISPGGETDTTPLVFADGPPPPDLFGVDGLKHRDLQVLSPINMALWDKAQWRGLGFAICSANPPIPELILMFEDLEAGAKIFRGWRKRFDEVDRNEWIGLTLITGIDRHHPAHYRLAISVNEECLTHRVTFKGQFAMVYRMLTMTPADSTNLNRFLHLYEKAGHYRLAPGLFALPQSMPPYAKELSIEKTQLRIVPAWQIGPNDPAIAALGGIDDPLIPSDVSDPPILKALKRFSGLAEKEEV